MNRANCLADRISADVQFHGVNKHGQFMFKNGSPLVTDLHVTLEDAVKRWGQRIKITGLKVLMHSTPFQNGFTAKSYAPREGADQQELHEYGSGYLKRLLEPVVPAVTIAAPVVVAPVVVPVAPTSEPLPVLPVPEPIILPPPPVLPLLPIETPAPKKRGRKAKVKGLPIN